MNLVFGNMCVRYFFYGCIRSFSFNKNECQWTWEMFQKKIERTLSDEYAVACCNYILNLLRFLFYCHCFFTFCHLCTHKELKYWSYVLIAVVANSFITFNWKTQNLNRTELNLMLLSMGTRHDMAINMYSAISIQIHTCTHQKKKKNLWKIRFLLYIKM